MEKIYSTREPERLLFVIQRSNTFTGREDLTSAQEPLQVMSISPEKDTVIPAHKHNPQDRVTKTTQEAIVVVKGKIESTLYDIDDTTILKTTILESGDCCITLGGGHSHRILEEGTQLYECKNGPYNGPEKDKTNLK